MLSRRTRAELRVGVPRRAGRPAPRPTKTPKRLKEQTFLFTEFLAKNGAGIQTTQARRARRSCTSTAITRRSISPPRGDCWIRSGLDVRAARLGLLRHGRRFRIRKAALRYFNEDWRARAACRAVREAAKNTLIVADGFSCREQIAQTTDRQALHIAQVMQMALHDGPEGPGGDYPEKRSLNQTEHRQSRSALATAALVGVGLMASGLLVWGLKKKARNS